MLLQRRDKILAFGIALFMILATIGGWFLVREVALVISVIVAVLIITTLELELFRRSQEKQVGILTDINNKYNQIESLFSLFKMLDIRHPLPSMSGWATLPDFLILIVSLIFERKPMRVVELGSGVSTLITGYCLSKLGRGTIITIDHDERFGYITKNNVTKHDLADIVHVIHAPLKELVINNEKWKWYDIDKKYLGELGKIDMLIVDGPPFSSIQRLSRYPALPVLFDRLSNDSIIILDDGWRADEKEIVNLWLNEYDCFESNFIETQKGTFVLRRIRN